MKVRKIWFIIALLFIGYSGGIITGVVVDVDTVYHTTVKKLKQKDSPGGSIVIDIENPEVKSKKELRQEKRDTRQEDREIKKAIRKSVG